MAVGWEEFSGATTIHGLRFVNSSTSVIRRLIWLTLVITGSVLFILQFHLSVKRFFEYKVNTVVYMSSDAEAKFPAITICNQNALRKSKIEENRDNPAVKKLMLNARKFLNLQREGDAELNLTNTIVTGQQMREVYMKYGHSMQRTTEGGMLYFCRKPNNEQCNGSDFKRVLTYSGLCYTFNSGENKILRTVLSGRFSAIKMVLSTQIDEYSKGIGRTSNKGIVVLVHDQLDPPVADSHGMQIGPGMSASISIQRQKILSLKSPYESRCDDKELSPSYAYSRAGCFRKCQEEFVIKTCKCSIAVQTILISTGVPLCTMDQNFNCAIPAATEQFSKAKELCKCPFACESIEYLPTVSYSPYPNDIDARKEATDMLVKEGKNVTEEGIRNKTLEFRKNMISLEIFYQQMDYLTMKHVEATTPVGLIAEIGGLLGISLGASFLTIMEIIDFVIFLVANKFSTIKKAKEVQVTQKESGRKNESLVT